MDAMPNFSCNLAENARQQKCFLEQIHELGVSVGRPNDKSLHRYQHRWLPLVHQHPDEKLIPPPDVAWLWHCHRLAPKDYSAYTFTTFGGCMVEANPPFVLQRNGDCEKGSIAEVTRALWSKMYPLEPFFLTEQAVQEPEDSFKADPLNGFDLLASTERQATFLWQVSGERFDDDSFLQEGVENYAKFLKLRPRASAENTLLVPTYQIDLMWHTHILSSITNYNKDCTALMGRTLHHDDSLTDRSDGGVLDVAYTATRKMWKNEYGCDYVVDGGMYRGEPPNEYFHADWKASEEWEAGDNLHLVGRMGASSTSPAKTWASPGGVASDGKPAFIKSDTTKRLQLKEQPHQEKYILGKTAHGVGYYHIETKEANQILLTRVRRRIAKLESDIAFAKCCCGRPNELAPKEKILADMVEARTVLSERVAASKPSGNVAKSQQTRDRSDQYYGDHGLWIYPVGLYDCAGGACGGGVACDTGGGCGAACGAGCGGGGCGGGGCGGGGCGG